MGKQYNYCLDFIKGIACLCVVLMHCEFPGILGTTVQTVGRFCVPLFFMVSGYFCFNPHTVVIGGGTLIIDKLKHIATITLNACLFYTVFSLVLFLLGRETDWALSIGGLFSWLVFNSPAWAGVAGQYWFLFALLYTYAAYWLAVKLNIVKQAYWLAGFMFVTYIILAQGCHLAGIHVPNMIYRNWLVEGFAYFMLGHWIHHYQDNLNYSNRVLLIIIAVSTLLCFVERYIMGRDFGVNIVSIPQVFCLFLYAVNNPTKHEGTLQVIGKRYSMFVYIIHPAVWHTLEFVYSRIGIENNMPALYVMPILVVIITLMCSHFVYTINLKFHS